MFVPAVKDVSTEQIEGKNTALGKLLARAVRSKTSFTGKIQELKSQILVEYQKLLDENQIALEELSLSLKKRLIDWAHPSAGIKVEWRQDPDKSVRVEEPLAEIIASEETFEGELARFGHGLQRSYLLALLHELSGSDDSEGPKLILGCEEPELYQHPPQARHLSDVLKKLSTRNSQIIVSTHSPYFVSGEGFEDVRVIKKNKGSKCSEVSFTSFEDLINQIAKAKGEKPLSRNGALVKIHQELQPSVNEIFFTPILILVEGPEDIAYITTYMHLLGNISEWRRLGCHLVCSNGKGHMISPLAVAKRMKIPTFVVFDSDGHKPDKNGSRTMHEKDNLAILRLCGISNPTAFPSDTFWASNVTMWNSEMKEVVKSDFSPDDWEKIVNAVNHSYGYVGGLMKNSLFIAEVLTTAWEQKIKSESLKRLCEGILSFAKQVNLETSHIAKV